MPKSSSHREGHQTLAFAMTLPTLRLHGVTIRVPEQHRKRISALVNKRIEELQQAQGTISRAALRKEVLETCLELSLHSVVTTSVQQKDEQLPEEPHANGRAAHANGGGDLVKDHIAQGPAAPSPSSTPVPGPHEETPLVADGGPGQGEAQDCPTKRQWHWLGAISEGGSLEIQGQLGQGTFGTVYAARFRGAPYALKVQSLDPLKPLESQHVYKELVALQELGCVLCPGIINCSGYFITMFNIQFLTEVFEMDLDKFNENNIFGITESHAKTLCRCIATGLHYMHDKGYVHRDLKPANILVRVEPLAAVIADLGCALRGEGAKEHVTTVTHQAPELFLGGGYIFPCDIWGFGLLCMEVEDSMALRGLWSGLGDWGEPWTQWRFLRRLLQKLTGPSTCLPLLAELRFATSTSFIYRLPLAVGGGSAFGKRFTNPSFGEFMRGLLALGPKKHKVITEVLGCRWLQVEQ